MGDYVRGVYWSSTEAPLTLSLGADSFNTLEGKTLMLSMNNDCFIRPVRAF